MGPRKMVMKAKEELKGLFEMKDIGKMTEYVGCKISWNWFGRSMTMTQPVKIQRFEDEYDQGITNCTPVTPLVTGTVLKKEGLGKDGKVHNSTEQKL